MTALNEQQILKKLEGITFSDNRKLLDLISNIIIKDRNVGFAIDITDRNYEEAIQVKNDAINKLNEIELISKISIAFTGIKPTGDKNLKPKHFIENVKKVILIASGKGGVGKSTVSALIAQQLNADGHQVGILDADIYGPSIPHIFNIKASTPNVNSRIAPIIAHNIQIMSIGFFAQDDTAIIWRGPMASKTIYQLLSLTKWHDLDYLIIDMPPGTSDVHLSILENYHIDGVIIVTAPSKLSTIDVERSINLYKRMHVPILGIIENMSYLLDPILRKNITIFSGNSGEYLTQKYNINLIDKIPIIPELSDAHDKGQYFTQIKLSLKI